jgi:hypothetical protein
LQKLRDKIFLGNTFFLIKASSEADFLSHVQALKAWNGEAN